MAWRIKCPPARPRIGERSRGGGSSSLGGAGCPRGWRRPLRPRGRRRLAGPKGPAKPKPGPKAPALCALCAPAAPRAGILPGWVCGKNAAGKARRSGAPRPRWPGRKQRGWGTSDGNSRVFPRFFKSGRGRGGSAPEVRPKQGARCQGERTHNGFYRLRLSKLLYKLWRKRIKSVYLFSKKNVMIEGRITIRRAKGI